MSVYLSLIEADWFIAAVDKQSAFDALKKEVTDAEGRVYGDLLWVDCDALKEAGALEEQLDAFMWPVETDADGNIVGIRFTGGKEGEETLLFRTLAPYVRSNSSITAEGGGDGRRWRWEFVDGKCRKKRVAKRRVKPSELGQYYKSNINRTYVITLDTHCVEIRTAADLERRLRNALDASNCGLEGYLPRYDRLAPLPDGLIGEYLKRNETESKCASIDIVISRQPGVELSVLWDDPNRIDCVQHVFASYKPLKTTGAYQYATVRAACGEDIEKEAAELLFDNLVRHLEPFWAEFIDCAQVGATASFAGLNAHNHYVPHLASRNYFGAVYAEFLGGAKALRKAGCEEVNQLGDGVIFGILSPVDPASFRTKRDAIEEHFSDLGAFGGEQGGSRRVPEFPLPPDPTNDDG